MLQPVRGTHDLLPDAADQFRRLIQKARRVALRFGFREIQTPIFEFTEVFSRTLGDASDIVSKEMYSFPDRGGDSITLRPEGTAGIARAFISEGLAQKLPLKLFYAGPMFRYERPQKGRQRQFHQIGIELLGVAGLQAEIECISLANMLLEELGLKGKFQLLVNSIGDTESRLKYRDQLVEFLTQYKTSLSEDSQRRLQQNPLRILDSKDPKDQEILRQAPKLEASLNSSSLEFFDGLKSGLQDLNIKFQVDPHLVRGLDYYSHTVFEFKSAELGAQDTLLAGGRYDGLIEMMGGPATPGVGWAAGLERLALLYQAKVKPKAPVTLVPLGPEAEKFCLQLAQRLRQSAFLVDMAYGGNLSKRMKKADSAGSIAALIIGSEELKKQVLMLKNLKTGDQTEVGLNHLEQTLEALGVSRAR